VPVSATQNCNGTSYPIFETVFVLTIPSRDDVTEFINTSLIILSDLTADQGRSIYAILNILEIKLYRELKESATKIWTGSSKFPRDKI
jgi:hypothetical protein